MAKKKPKPPARSVAQPEAMAAVVASRVKIVALVLTDCSASRTPEARIGGDATRLEMGIVDVGFLSEPGAGKIVVTPRFSLEVRAVKPPDAAPTLQIEATFAAMYSYDAGPEFTDEQVQAFARINGVFNVWPYWREFVQNTVQRMGLGSITLPLSKFEQP